MGLEHPARTDAKVENTDRPRSSDKPPGPPPDNPGAPGYPSRRESLARAREPVQQEGGTQQAAVKDRPAQEMEARDDEPASTQADSGEAKDESGPEAPDREEDAAKPEAEADASEPGEESEQDQRPESAGEKAETHDDPVSSKRQHTLPTDNPGSPHQPSRRESHAREPDQQDAGAPETESTDTDPTAEPAVEPASPTSENGTTKTERSQEQESSPQQDREPGADEPSPTSEPGNENTRDMAKAVAQEPESQPEDKPGNDLSAGPTSAPDGTADLDGSDDAADDLGRRISGEEIDEDALERGISERLRKLAAKLDRSDGPRELGGLVDRPDFQDPEVKPEYVPDRYGTPLDRDDGTRTPLFNGMPKREQAQQGELGDCGIIATLGAVAAHQPETLRTCVSETEDGNYQVRLHEAEYSVSRRRYEPTGASITLTLTPDLPVNDEAPDKPAFAPVLANAAWAPVLEKAIAGTDQTWSVKRQARVNEIWNARGNPGDAPTGYVRLNQGSGPGERAELLTQLTGLPAKSVQFPSGYDNQGRSADRQLHDEIFRQLSHGKPVLVGTRDKREGESRLSKGLRANHAYEVTKIDDQGRFHLRNPWGRKHPEPMTIQEFKREARSRYTTLE
ncbi:C2 family cysteine protease [Spirillospora sp. CA-108201]